MPARDGKIKIVSLAGGTGRYSMLQGLRERSDVSVTAFYNPTDFGNSQRVLRVDYGVLPFGDGIQAMAALAIDPLDAEVLRYRHGKGQAENLRPINLLYVAYRDLLGSETAAARKIAEKYPIQGDVIPVSESCDIHLVVEREDGSITTGEDLIDTSTNSSPIIRATLSSPAKSTAAARQALEEADLILFGPGDLYTSTIPNLLVDDIPEIIAQSSAQKILICNLFTKPNETPNYTSVDFAKAITHAGDLSGQQRFKLDAVLVNDNGFDVKTLARYLAAGQEPVILGEGDHFSQRVQVVSFSHSEPVPTESGKGEELMIRNDPNKTVKAVLDAYQAGKEQSQLQMKTRVASPR